MRIIALGDIHGKDCWKQIVIHESFDKVVFIGDYFDSWDISPKQQMDNFKDIIAYKKAHPNKVVLLFGNHDYHYLRGVTDTYSGYKGAYRTDIEELLQEALNEDLLQMCFMHDNLLFSHAGVTQTWCRNNGVDYNALFIDVIINDLFKFKPDAFKFTFGGNGSLTGDDVEQSPIWVRPNSLLQDRIKEFIQVVGHTMQRKIRITDDVILIDVFDSTGEYLVYDDGKLSIGLIPEQ